MRAGLTGCFYCFERDFYFWRNLRFLPGFVISGGIFYFCRNLLFLAEPGSPAGVGGENEAASAKGPRAGHHERRNPENFFGDEQSARPVIILHSGHRHFVLRLLHVE